MIGLLTGFISGVIVSYFVSRHFYLLGRKDATESIRQQQLTSIEGGLRSRLTELAPMRKENVRKEDGVDSTYHFFLCQSDILRNYGYMKASEIVSKIAEEMRQWQIDNSGADTESAKNEKSKWSAMLSGILEDS